MAILISEVKSLVDSDVGKFLLGLVALLTLGKKQIVMGALGIVAYDIGKNTPLTDQENSALGRRRLAARVLEGKIQAELNKYKKFELDLLKQKTELDKLKDKFDTERIGLMVALNAATDEDTKLRIKSQIAILDNNEALAKKYNAELEAANSARKLAQELTATTDAMAKLRVVTREDYTKQMYAGSSIYYNGGGNAAPVPMGSASAGTGTTNNDNSVTLNVPGGIVDSEGLLSTVQEALQRLNKQGSPTYAAGQ
jgi:hypothetical protein